MKTFLVLLVIVLLAGCTTLPSRFIMDDNPEFEMKEVGYVIEAEDLNGFDLEIFYANYSFWGIPEESIQRAKDYFKSRAAIIATKKEKTIKPILSSELRINSPYNTVDGNYSVYVAGRVLYLK